MPIIKIHNCAISQQIANEWISPKIFVKIARELQTSLYRSADCDVCTQLSKFQIILNHGSIFNIFQIRLKSFLTHERISLDENTLHSDLSSFTRGKWKPKLGRCAKFALHARRKTIRKVTTDDDRHFSLLQTFSNKVAAPAASAQVAFLVSLLAS